MSGILKFKNDSGPVTVFADAIGAVVLETRSVQRVWMRGGGTFTVHGSHEEIVREIEDAQIGPSTPSIPDGEKY